MAYPTATAFMALFYGVPAAAITALTPEVISSLTPAQRTLLTNLFQGQFTAYALYSPRSVGDRIAAFAPDAVHIATEGPLCLAARSWCLRQCRAFTTAYHTQFPDYVAARTGMPTAWVWRYIRWFHRPAAHVLTSTSYLVMRLTGRARPGAAQGRRISAQAGK